MNNDRKVRDPVCGMLVELDQRVFEFQGLRFAFCSQQCRDRFESNPHIYIGQAGRSAAKQRGEVRIKTRTMKLHSPITDEFKLVLRDSLHEMMGVKHVRIEGNIVQITYDLLEATAEQIGQTIEESGNRLSQSLGTKLRHAFVHCLEEIELDALETQISDRGCHHH